jgi:hypothetical protein
MRRIIADMALTAAVALALAGCGFADSRAPVPEFMRKTSETSPPEAPPDVKRMVGEKLETVFSVDSHPRHVQVSRPLRDPRGLDWSACVKADLTSVNGKPLGNRTYRITISGGAIIDRRHVEADDPCATESYEPV